MFGNGVLSAIKDTTCCVPRGGAASLIYAGIWHWFSVRLVVLISSEPSSHGPSVTRQQDGCCLCNSLCGKAMNIWCGSLLPHKDTAVLPFILLSPCTNHGAGVDVVDRQADNFKQDDDAQHYQAQFLRWVRGASSGPEDAAGTHLFLLQQWL